MIEFAVCMPILIILLFYIHDLVRIKRYYSQTEFVAQQMANIIQNISQKRENKKITKNDLKYIFCLACQSLYPANALFRQSKGYAFGHFPIVILHYVKDVGEGKVSHCWRDLLWSTTSPGTPQNITNSISSNHQKLAYSQINELENADPTSIYKTLKIAPAKEKIIIECFMYNYRSYTNLEGVYLPPKEAFGLRLLSPRGLDRGFFHSVVIFTPKPGLFSEKPPTES